MRAITLHLTNIDSPGYQRSIEQGSKYDGVIFLINKDLTGWKLKGQIRNNYREELDSVIKAEFSFPAIEYKEYLVKGERSKYSQIKPILTHQQTEALDWLRTGMRNRTSSTQAAVAGVNAWVYDIEGTDPNGAIFKIARGYVDVIPEVTQ